MTEENKVKNEEKLLKEWCKREDIDYVLAKTLKGKIFPLLEEAHNRQGSIFDRTLLEQKKGTDIRFRNSERLLKILPKLDQNKFTTEEKIAISLHLEFLMLVEGLFATQTNFLIFTLISNGHNFHLPRKRKYAKTFDDIEEADLAPKMKFLKKHNFKELTKNEHNIRKLRNSVAHVFYEIDSSVGVRIGNKKVSEKDYIEYYKYIRNVSFAVHIIRNLYYLQFLTSLPPAQREKIEQVKLQEVKCTCGYVNLLPDDRRVLGLQFECTKCSKPIS